MRYVYGVVRPSMRAPERAGIRDAPVELVSTADLAALVSELPDEGELVAQRDDVFTHARVLEDTIKEGPVLPARFGTVLPDSDAVVEALLERHHEALVELMGELEGMVELNLRAVYEEEVVMAELVRDNPDIRQLSKELRGQPEDATYYARISLGEMVAAALEQQRERDAERILAPLGELAAALDIGQANHERVVLSASFLVQRDLIEQFDRAVDSLGEQFSGRINFRYTGPLPPHSFVELPTEG